MSAPLRPSLARSFVRCYILLLIGLLYGASPVAAQQDLLGYWNFNTPAGSGSPWPAPVPPTFGTGAITYTFDAGNVADFAGNDGNAQGGDLNGASFSVSGSTQNGRSLDIAVSTEGAENIELAFWARRSSTGFNANTLSYSTDGGATFTEAFAFDPDDTTGGAVETFDGSGIPALEDNPDVVFRIALDGASGNGSIRLDNVTVRGDLPPADGPIALTTIDTPVLLNFQGFRAGGFAASPSLGQVDADAFALFGASEGDVGFGQTAASGDFAGGTDAGGVGTGGVYAFDTSKPADLSAGYGDYALGLQPTGSDFSPGAVYVCYENATGAPINDGARIAYDLWTLNDTDSSRRVMLKYAVGAGCQTDGDDASSFADSGIAFTIPEFADTVPQWTRNALAGEIAAGVPTGAFLTLAFVTTDEGGSGGSPEIALNNIAVTPRATPGGPRVIRNATETLREDFNLYGGAGFASPPASPQQLDSGAFLVRGLSDGDVDFGETRTTGDFARGASAGGASTGGVYAFDVGAGDVAWGVQASASDATPGRFVARYLNDTGGPINDLAIGYDIKVFNDADRATRVAFAYKKASASTYDPGGFTDVPALDYTTPEAASATPGWQTVPRSAALSDIALQNGEYLLVRIEVDDASGSGSRDEVALDNLTLTPNPPTVSFVGTERAVWSTDGTVTFDVQIRNPGSEARSVAVAFDGSASTANPADVGNVGSQTVTFPAGSGDGATQSVSVPLNAFSGEPVRTARFVLQNPSMGVAIGANRAYTLDIGDAPRLVISRYIDTSAGSTPKGLQLWNVSGAPIDFAADPLAIRTYSNGDPGSSSTTTVDTGTLAPDAVLIVGASDDGAVPGDMGAKAQTCSGVRFVEEAGTTWFNGNDAIAIELGGRTEDVFGTIGVDPGTSWSGNGVSTADQYLGIQPGTTAGTRNGFTDPSTRFLTLGTDPETAERDAPGFCNAPWPEVAFQASESTVTPGDTETTTLGANLQVIPAEGRAVAATVTFDAASSTASAPAVDDFTSTALTFPAGVVNDTTEAVLDLAFPANASQDGPLEAVFRVEVPACFTGECFAEARSEPLTVTLLDRDSAPEVLITEFMAMPDAVPDADGEWVELYNPASTPRDLSGWTLQTAAPTDAALSGTLPPRSFLTVCRNSDPTLNGGVACDWEAPGLRLDDTGATLAVRDDAGRSVTTVAYGTARSAGTLDPVAGQASVFTGTAQNNNAARWARAERREKGYLFARGRTSRTDRGSPGQNGPKQQLQPATAVSGQTGWRMLAPPVTGFTVADLATQNMVQGVPDLPLGGQDNVYRWESTGWEPAGSGSDALPPGQGFIWFMWDSAAPVDAYSPFPFTLDAPGSPPTTDVSVNVENGGTTDAEGNPDAGGGVEWHLLGNPYPYTFDLDALDLDAQGFTTTAQIWDPSLGGGSGSYVQRSQENAGAAGQIAPWQGFFVARASGAATQLTFQASGRRLAPVAPTASAPTDTQARIAFTLSGYDEAGALQTHDAAFEVFLHPEATMGFDVRSAVKLTPMTSTYVTMAGRDVHNGVPLRLARYSLPWALAETTAVPVVLDAANADAVATLTMQWPTLHGLPDGWQVHLYDLETDTAVNLREQDAYTFEAAPSALNAVASAQAARPRATTLDAHAGRPHRETPVRFEVRITPPGAADGALPVELTDFTVQTAGDGATLRWKTQSEANNAGFAVQHRGPQDRAFTTLGFVDGAGTATTPQSYTFAAEALVPGEHRFRLQQHDTDGTTALSAVQAVTVALGEPVQLRVYPVPVQARATVQFAVERPQRAVVEVYNMLGQRVRTLHEGPLSPHTLHTVDWAARGLASGLYVVRLRGEHVQATQRITVVR